jgi:hypothetical protein
MAIDFTSYVYGKDFQDGATNNDWSLCDSGHTLTGGYRYNSKNWVLALKFTMPKNASSITFGFFSISGANDGEDANIKYKISTTEDTAPNYTYSTHGDGRFVLNNPYERTNVTITRNFKSGVTYYIYFYTDNDTSNTNNLMRIRWYPNTDDCGFYATYEELTGCIYIDNGTSFDAYECYIDNGSGWDLYIPYIDNGSSWDICG